MKSYKKVFNGAELNEHNLLLITSSPSCFGLDDIAYSSSSSSSIFSSSTILLLFDCQIDDVQKSVNQKRETKSNRYLSEENFFF